MLSHEDLAILDRIENQMLERYLDEWFGIQDDDNDGQDDQDDKIHGAEWEDE